jgi:SNF2 family DNA or RNA helicase
MKVLAEIEGNRIVLEQPPGSVDRRRAVLVELSRVTFGVEDPMHPRSYAPLTWPTLVQLESSPELVEIGPRLQQWKAREIWRRVLASDGKVKAALPEGFEPYPWQAVAATRIAELGHVMLCDDPGTGKTFSALMGLLERQHRYGDALPAVIVSPASVVDSWVQSAGRLSPWKVVAWRGTAKRRHALAGQADVYVMSYDTMRRDKDVLKKLQHRAVVLDEAHYIKSPDAKRTKAAWELTNRCPVVVALTGTPVSRSPEDIFSALKSLDRQSWPSKYRWVSRYCVTKWGPFGDEVVGLDPRTEPEFRRSIEGQLRRISKADALGYLPPKVYSVRYVDMPAAYMRAYKSLERDMFAEMPDGEEISEMDAIVVRTRLRTLASGAADVKARIEIDEEGNERKRYDITMRRPCWKADALLEVLEERPGRPVVAFSHSRQLINIAGEMAEEAGYRVGYVVGGQKAEERTGYVQAFQDGKLDLLCVTTQAGGVGITLTRSDCAVFLTRPDNLVDAIQAEDRLHRIGAEHESIEIIDIRTRGTIDEVVPDQLRTKIGHLADMVEDQRISTEFLGGEPCPLS